MSSVTDSGDDVKKAILKCKVYKSDYMVAARVLKLQDIAKVCPNEPVPADNMDHHAEYRTLSNIDALNSGEKINDLLLFYVSFSPCFRQCTNSSYPLNILEKIKEINNWTNHIVVFSKVYQPNNSNKMPDTELRDSIKRLGDSVGLENIFRCSEQLNGVCTSCANGNEVTSDCYTVDLPHSVAK